MKKILFAAITAMAVMMYTSCEPTLLNGGEAKSAISSEELAASFVITGQYADEACTIPQKDGNYLRYTTKPAVNIQICFVKAGSESILTVGPSGMFKILPRRNGNPQQTITLKTIGQDGTMTKADATVTVAVPTGSLQPEYELLLTDAGTQSWTWNDEIDDVMWEEGGYYGEGGNTGAGTDFEADYFDGTWWGTGPDGGLEGYAWLTGEGVTPDMDENAYMTFDEEGVVIVYGADGTEFRKGSYEIKNWNPDRHDDWELGNLITNSPCTLFPYTIHTEETVTNFQIMYLDGNKMVLCNPEGTESGDWDSITYWMFKVKK